jgi:steroid Delta-isomerase
MTTPTPELQKIVQFYENLSEQSVAQLHLLYAEQAYFKDPFNEVTGIAPIAAIFREMFVQVSDPRFKVLQAIHNQTTRAEEMQTADMPKRAVLAYDAFLIWEFRFRFKGFKSEQTQMVRGSSHLRFDEERKISFHRDYWDVAEELYEKIPVLGGLMRFLKRRAQHRR